MGKTAQRIDHEYCSEGRYQRYWASEIARELLLVHFQQYTLHHTSIRLSKFVAINSNLVERHWLLQTFFDNNPQDFCNSTNFIYSYPSSWHHINQIDYFKFCHFLRIQLGIQVVSFGTVQVF